MDSALAKMIQGAAGTGAPTNPSSRYYGANTLEYVGHDGVAVRYLARRIVPQPGVYTSTQTYSVSEGDRIDNLSSKYLGDPLLYWMIADVNSVMDAESLTQTPGKNMQLPLATGVPPGARNG